MDMNEAIELLQTQINLIKSQRALWSIVVLDRGWVFVGKLTYDEDGNGVLTHAANIRQWGTTQGLPEIQSGPTPKTVLDRCSLPIRFQSAILTLDAAEEGWENAY